MAPPSTIRKAGKIMGEHKHYEQGMKFLSDADNLLAAFDAMHEAYKNAPIVSEQTNLTIAMIQMYATLANAHLEAEYAERIYDKEISGNFPHVRPSRINPLPPFDRS
jgi:hypothetical protein